MIKRLYKRIRYAPERWLHSGRRRSAIARMEGLSPDSVHFVCHGNICRSPFAAHYFRSILPEPQRSNLRVTSAGFTGPGRPAPEAAIRVGRAMGVDLSKHRSRLLCRSDVNTADLIVVMNVEQARAIRAYYFRPGGEILILGDLDPTPIETRTILDPFGSPDDAFVESYSRITRCLDELVKVLAFGTYATGSPPTLGPDPTAEDGVPIAPALEP